MRLHCIRHSRPRISGICYGHKDIAVEPFELDLDIRQVVHSCTAIYSSPSLRCLEMAHVYAGDQPVAVDSRLMEMNFGEWEGIPWGEIPIDQLDDWVANVSRFAPPAGESFERLVARVSEWLNEVNVPSATEQVVFTHGGVIKALRVLALDECYELAANYCPPFHQVISFEFA